MPPLPATEQKEAPPAANHRNGQGTKETPAGLNQRAASPATLGPIGKRIRQAPATAQVPAPTNPNARLPADQQVTPTT